MTTSLFSVIINVDGDDETGRAIYEVHIVDRYHEDLVDKIIGAKINMHSLDEAMQFAKGAVTAFMSGEVKQ
jgi:hypothetical protein